MTLSWKEPNFMPKRVAYIWKRIDGRSEICASSPILGELWLVGDVADPRTVQAKLESLLNSSYGA